MSLKGRLSAIRTILLLTCIALTGRSNAQNLITNPGFENALNGWTLINADTTIAHAFADSSVSLTGHYSLEVTIRDTDIAINDGAFQKVHVNPGHHYLLTGNIETYNVSGLAYVYVNLGDTAELFEYGLQQWDSISPWHQVQSRIITPPGTTYFTVSLILSAVSGTAYFDDISLTDLGDTATSLFAVQADSVTGLIRPFLSTNVGPVNNACSVNLTPQFEQLGLNDVRTHDFYGPCDLHVIFPDTTRDPLDSTAYYFASTDSVITPVIAYGAQVLFRLGESWESPMIYNYPPRNFSKTAQVFVQIVKHYNAGWDNGFNYNIKEWEIWNEPDASYFWTGTPQQYATFYHVAAQAIKSYDSTLQVGGPAAGSLFAYGLFTCFLDSVSINHWPMDFFSYHYYYTANPYNYIYADSMALNWLNHYGLGGVKRYLDEWNNYVPNNNDNFNIWRNDPFIAASVVSTITYLQQTTLTKAFHYRTDQPDFGIFDNLGNYTYQGLACRTITGFMNASQELVASGGDSLGKTILAGKNQSGDSLIIVVADNSSPVSVSMLTVNGLAVNDSFNYQVYRIDSTHLYQLYQSGGINYAHDTISLQVAAPYVDQFFLDRVEKASALFNLPYDSIYVYPNPASDFINFRLNNSIQNAELSVFNVQGQLMSKNTISSNSSSYRLELNNYSAGVYIYRLQQSDAIYTGKFVKMGN